MKTNGFAVLLMAMLAVLSSCKKNRFEIDPNSVNLDVKIERFDKDFNNIDTVNISASLQSMRQKYGEMFDRYVVNVIGVGREGDLSVNVSAFLNDSMYKEVYAECQRQYGDVSDIEDEVELAMKYIKFYFPEKKIPRFGMHISGFNQSIMATKDMMSASIDCYLGADYIPYQDIAYSYQIAKMTRNNVAMDLVYAYIYTEFGVAENGTLLQSIIDNGKLLYLMNIVMPGRTDKDIMGYNDQQYEWCVNNEKQMWNYLIAEKRLYNTSHLVISKFVNPAPFTSEFPQESPGQAVLWLGMRIVESYMDNNKNIGLKELMAEKNAQKILEESNYKP